MIYEIQYPEDRGLKYDSFRYPGGEVQVRLKKSELDIIRGASGLVVTARVINGEISELAQLTDALFSISAFEYNKVLFLPYLPYSRADRRFVEGDGFGLSVFARLINSLGYSEIKTLDAHSGKAGSLILNLVNLSPVRYIQNAVDDIGRDDLTILLPDKGALRYNLDYLRIPILQADKQRDPSNGKLLGFQVPLIPTRKVIIVDDICDGGGTFVGIAEEIDKQLIAVEPEAQTELYLWVTHGIFSKGLAPLINFNKIYTTDSFKSKDVLTALAMDGVGTSFLRVEKI